MAKKTTKKNQRIQNKNLKNQRKARKSQKRKSTMSQIKTYIIKKGSLISIRSYKDPKAPKVWEEVNDKPMLIDADLFSHEEKCRKCDCGNSGYFFVIECEDGCCDFEYVIDKRDIVESTKMIEQLTTDYENNIIFSCAA